MLPLFHPPSITIRAAACLLAAGTGSLLFSHPGQAQTSIDRFASLLRDGRGILLVSASGHRLRLTPYGNFIIRVQAARPGEEFLPDNHYAMVESHSWPGAFTIEEGRSSIELGPAAGDGIRVRIGKNPLRASFLQQGERGGFLQDLHGIVWSGDSITASFVSDSSERFMGLGHDFYGRTPRLDLRGRRVGRNYGTMHRQQAPLIVPFFLSSKGYGLFLNSTFPNMFSFGAEGRYEAAIAGNGVMDYFVILGPGWVEILDRYTQLTGRPRFPPKAAFGLALSDKGNDHTSADPSDERWWKRMVEEHRGGGFPIDHLVNDNRWRAGGGKRCESFFAWDSVRFPDPAEYQEWVRRNGLIVTLDFNRCIAGRSEGWTPGYNLPETAGIEFAESAPDFSNPAVRKWFWGLFWNKSLDPRLRFPGDALWIDEFDEMGGASPSLRLASGRTWGEMRNYWFFLIARALVEEGWDRSFHGARRPFVWVRGMTAGAQRYATLWSGDIRPTYDEMAGQVRGMQAAGISGFPYWGHDAGGFYDYERKSGPDEEMYRQWSMAFGSFTPFWKPHGMGQSRWPLQRSVEAQEDARKYARLRYELLPYTYTSAHLAASTGTPIARPMAMKYPKLPEAWKRDLQYLWGEEILIAPNCSTEPEMTLWLPPGRWFDFWNDSLHRGNQIRLVHAPIGVMPIFVRAGAIIPRAPFALGTALIRSDTLAIHIYPGADGSFTLYEDDGTSEGYRRGEFRKTRMTFTQSAASLTVAPAEGSYSGAPPERAYAFVFHRPSREPIVKRSAGRIPVTRRIVISFARERGH